MRACVFCSQKSHYCCETPSIYWVNLLEKKIEHVTSFTSLLKLMKLVTSMNKDVNAWEREMEKKDEVHL